MVPSLLVSDLGYYLRNRPKVLRNKRNTTGEGGGGTAKAERREIEHTKHEAERGHTVGDRGGQNNWGGCWLLAAGVL